MPKYLVTYHETGQMPHDPESMAKAREAFMQWAGKTGAALVEPGAPIGATRVVSSSGAEPGSADGPFNGWSVVEAPDVDAAMAILADHPFIGRGGLLQVSEPVGF
jgi:hypothetical protein